MWKSQGNLLLLLILVPFLLILTQVSILTAKSPLGVEILLGKTVDQNYCAVGIKNYQLFINYRALRLIILLNFYSLQVSLMMLVANSKR